MRAKELVQSITGSKGFVLEDITGSTSRPALSVSVLLMCSPVFVVIPHTALLFTALCGTSFPVPHNAVLSACRFGYPSILLLSFPDSLSGCFSTLLGVYPFPSSPPQYYILSLALTDFAYSNHQKNHQGLTMDRGIKTEMAEHLVFLDESGVNTNLTRLYGRAPSSPKAVDHAPLEYTADNDRSFLRSSGWGESIYNLPGRNDRRMFCPVLERDFTSGPSAL